MLEAKPATFEIALTHFIVSDDVELSRRFYTEVLGGKTVRAGEPSIVALANSWIIINLAGGPTDDKPSVTLETPRDPDRTSSSSTSGSRTSKLHTASGARGARSSSHHRYSTRTRSAATSATPMAT
jgi:hypothetical protein